MFKNGHYTAAEKYPKQPSIPPMPDISQMIKLKTFYECKYYLPCGDCDKNGEKCRMKQACREENRDNGKNDIL
jgi:hypothetical protein